MELGKPVVFPPGWAGRVEHAVKPCVEAFLAARGLELSQEKTKITHISEGFDFLGQNVRKYGSKLLIKPSAKNVKAFLDNVRETIRANRSVKQEALIDLLNPMIRGWANYHRHVVAKSTYAAVDAHIWHALWRWARRRHPNKSCGWVRQKYFWTLDHRHWVFASAVRGYNGEPRILALFSASDTRIVRHVRVQADANPFDSGQVTRAFSARAAFLGDLAAHAGKESAVRCEAART